VIQNNCLLQHALLLHASYVCFAKVMAGANCCC